MINSQTLEEKSLLPNEQTNSNESNQILIENHGSSEEDDEVNREKTTGVAQTQKTDCSSRLFGIEKKWTSTEEENQLESKEQTTCCRESAED